VENLMLEIEKKNVQTRLLSWENITFQQRIVVIEGISNGQRRIPLLREMKKQQVALIVLHVNPSMTRYEAKRIISVLKQHARLINVRMTRHDLLVEM
jgi:hypothetical protein